MSSKRNRTRYSRKKAQVSKTPVMTKAQVTEDLLAACDGYSNAAAFIGEDSPLMSSGTFIRSGLTSQANRKSDRVGETGAARYRGSA